MGANSARRQAGRGGGRRLAYRGPVERLDRGVHLVTTIPAPSDAGVSLAFRNDSEAWGSVLQLVLNVTVLTAVAIAGLPVQRAIWRRAARRAARPVRIVG